MDSKDIECYRINYNIDGWKRISEEHGYLCAPFGAILAINALCDEVESLRKDAARYRWIRKSGCPFAETDEAWESGENLDSAIDKAMEE